MENKLGILISGVRGRMGKSLVASLAGFEDLFLAGGLEHAKHEDLGKEICGSKTPKIQSSVKQAVGDQNRALALIEFTSPQATLEHLKDCVALQIPMVIGTTGFTDQELLEIKRAAQKTAVVMSPNFSIGVNLMIKVAEELAEKLPNDYDLEIVEMHHRLKKDAPSGTALRLAQALASGRKTQLDQVICMHREGVTGERPKDQIGVQTLRGGDVVGDHTLFFVGPGERLELKHQAHTRENFAQGALRAAQYIWQRKLKTGLYDMFDVLQLKK